MNKIINILKWIIVIILSMLIILNLYIIIASEAKPNKITSIFGYKPFVVLSGSMSPNIQVGDLIIIKQINPTTLKENDVIAFKNSANYVTTHRIIDVQMTNNQKCFQTKGDANNVLDEKIVCPKNVEGKYVTRIPKLGNIILFIQKPLGFIIMISTVFFIGLIFYLIDNNKKNKKELEELKKMGRLKKEE